MGLSFLVRTAKSPNYEAKIPMCSSSAPFLVCFYWQKIKNVGAPTFSTARNPAFNCSTALTCRV